MFKRNRRLDLALKLSSVILITTGAVVGTITLNPIILADVSWTVFYYRQLQLIKIFPKKKKRGLYICHPILPEITQHSEIMF